MQLVSVAAAAAMGAVVFWRFLKRQSRIAYRGGGGGRCPFCNRVGFRCSHLGIPYTRVLYGYGAGAKPDKCEGHGYGDGPLYLTGQKLLPVLEGPGVPTAPSALGMPESLEICAFLIGQHRAVMPCDAMRADVKAFIQELTRLKVELVESRIVKMPVPDWADKRDVDYRRYKKKLPLEWSITPQPELCEQLSHQLAQLPSLMRGPNCLNSWGFSMDDVVLLPQLRAFTCVKGVQWPAAVEKYLNIEATQMTDYRPHAL